MGLSLVNIVLEAGGEALGSFTPLVSVCQVRAPLCVCSRLCLNVILRAVF